VPEERSAPYDRNNDDTQQQRSGRHVSDTQDKNGYVRLIEGLRGDVQSVRSDVHSLGAKVDSVVAAVQSIELRLADQSRAGQRLEKAETQLQAQQIELARAAERAEANAEKYTAVVARVIALESTKIKAILWAAGVGLTAGGGGSAVLKMLGG